MTKRDAITIEAAADGGFMALGASEYGDRARPLFAGSLNEVIDYAEKRLTPPPEVEEARVVVEGPITLSPEDVAMLKTAMGYTR